MESEVKKMDEGRAIDGWWANKRFRYIYCLFKYTQILVVTWVLAMLACYPHVGASLAGNVRVLFFGLLGPRAYVPYSWWWGWASEGSAGSGPVSFDIRVEALRCGRSPLV